MARISATARRLKVTAVLDVSAFADLRLPDGAPARSELMVSVNGRNFRADVATKSVRRVLANIAEHGADGVVVLILGTLGAGDEIIEAGLVAQPKAPAKAYAALAPLVGGLVALAALWQATTAWNRHRKQTEADRQRRITESYRAYKTDNCLYGSP